MQKTAEREKLGSYYQSRFDYFKRQIPFLDELTLEAHLNLVRTGGMLHQAVDQRMRSKNLTAPAFGILCLLESAPGKQLTMNEIGERLVVSQANVTGLVDTLVARGYVQRKGDADDRRVRRIRITSAGSRKLEDIHPGLLKFIQSLYGTLTRGEKGVLIRALEKVRKQLLKGLALAALAFALAAPAHAEVPAPSTAPAQALSLQDCYALALKQNESLQIQREQIRQLQEQYQQIFGSIYPKASFNASDFFQDTHANGSGGGSSTVGNTLTQGERPEAKFTLSQPIFAGFREFSAGAGLKAEMRKGDLALQRGAKLLFQDVARAFYQVVQNQTDLADVRTILDLTRDRIKELRDRVRLGKSRESEVLSVESQFAAVQAQEVQVRGALAISLEQLALLTGSPLDQSRLVDGLPRQDSLEPEERILGRADNRTDVRAAQEEVRAQQYAVRSAKGALWPTAGALGNYYTKRTGFQDGIDWDVLLSLSVPIFEGGTIRAGVRQAQAQLRAAQIDLGRLLRQNRSEIRQGYINLKTSVDQSRTLEEAYQKAEASYRLQVREYRLGLVNNLDVLQAMNAMEDTKRNFDRALVQGKLDLLQLKVATEEMP